MSHLLTLVNALTNMVYMCIYIYIYTYISVDFFKTAREAWLPYNVKKIMVKYVLLC